MKRALLMEEVLQMTVAARGEWVTVLSNHYYV